MGLLRIQAQAGPDANLSLVQRTCYALHALCNVRGYKTVVKFLPHEVNDLERTLALLLLSRSKGHVPGEDRIPDSQFRIGDTEVVVPWTCLLRVPLGPT
eukprot:1187615-Prorocentrum_minimum.AAC.3